MQDLSRFLVCLLLFIVPSAEGLRARGKLDVIKLKNGDAVTGEITGLERGILSVKTEYMGTIKIEWRGVQRILSPQNFELEVGDGTRFEGTLSDPGEDEQLIVDGVSRKAVPLRRNEVVRIRTMDETFLDRLDARVDFGFDLTRANQNTTYTLDSELNYRAERFNDRVKFGSFLTDQKDLGTQTRNDLSLSHEQFMRDRWFGLGVGQFQQNEELGLDLRSAGGAGIGRYLVQSNRLLLRGAAGAVYNNEKFVDTDPESSAVSFGFIGLDFFQFEGSERDLSIDFAVWPSLSDIGRVRADLSVSIRFEIIGDLNWGLTFWDNYDSRPPNEDSVKNDYGLSTTVGYSF